MKQWRETYRRKPHNEELMTMIQGVTPESSGLRFHWRVEGVWVFEGTRGEWGWGGIQSWRRWWCTWDAFYTDVTAEGVEEGLKR